MTTTTIIPIGQAAVFNFSITAGGSPDTTTPATADASVPGIFRVTVNPDNNRQFAVVALAAGSTNANVHCGSVTLHAFCTATTSSPPPDGGAIDEAGVTIGAPPSWA